ncbi:MAG: alpha/beta hydrolase [Actinomycetota bacterium]|nr:alpha/beta hydrolase [Actinomycetota bacterium]
MPRPLSRTAPTARLSEADLAPLDDSVHIWPGKQVQVGAASVYIRTTPTSADDAEPALFVHGLGGSAHNWTDFAGVLRHRLAAEAIDLLGHGRSGPAPDNDYSLPAQARTVIAYLEQSGRGPVHLVGNSMGGAVCILVASQRPDLIRTLSLISPAVPDNRVRVYPLRNDPRVALLAVPVVGEFALRKMNSRVAPEVRVKGTIALCFADASRYPAERMREAVAESRDRLEVPWADSAFLRAMRGLAKTQLLRGRSGWATLRSIEAPTLVLWGDTDRLVAPDLAPYVAAAIPDSRLLVLEHIGHTAMMEDPLASARAMLGLLDDVATARS